MLFCRSTGWLQLPPHRRRLRQPHVFVATWYILNAGPPRTASYFALDILSSSTFGISHFRITCGTWHECRQVCVCGFVCVVPFMRLCDFGWTAWIVQNYYLFMHIYLHCNVCEAFVELRNSHGSIDLWNSEVFTRHCNGNTGEENVITNTSILRHCNITVIMFERNLSPCQPQSSTQHVFHLERFIICVYIWTWSNIIWHVT